MTPKSHCPKRRSDAPRRAELRCPTLRPAEEDKHRSETTQLLDDAVVEVFDSMLGLRCAATEPKKGADASGEVSSAQMTAIVGFAGVMSGACVMSVSHAGALRMVGSMLGTEAEHETETMADGLGEVCNMVTGRWKSRVPALASGCLLSVPMVISGEGHHVYAAGHRMRVERDYMFEGHRMHLTLTRTGDLSPRAARLT